MRSYFILRLEYGWQARRNVNNDGRVPQRANEKLVQFSIVELHLHHRTGEPKGALTVAGDYVPNRHRIVCGCTEELFAVATPTREGKPSVDQRCTHTHTHSEHTHTQLTSVSKRGECAPPESLQCAALHSPKFQYVRRYSRSLRGCRID